ncbi:MAG TPA: ABC transporter permease [Chthonomonadaceae bacterium]|nr:ABC transporter permease [Chthonomonadaceae bacterium]
MNVQRLLAVAYKELREVVRDRISFLLTFLMPPMMMLVFGYGMSQDVEHVPFVIIDYDRTALSRDYAYHYISSRYFAFQGYAENERSAERLMAHGDIRVILIIPERFQERLLAGRSTQIQSLLDGTFTVPVRTIRGYIQAISSEASGEMQAAYVAQHAGIPVEQVKRQAQPLNIAVRYLYNQEMRNTWTVAPLLLMMILIWTTPLLMALSVVREKETGSIYNMYASTVSRAEYLVGKLLPNIGFSSINVVLLYLLATVYYGAPFKGSLPAFALVSLLYVVALSSLGLLISLLVRVQQAALLISIVLAMIIMEQYSGMSAPIQDMTGVNYFIAHLFPAMYYTDAIQIAFLKGGGILELWQDLGALAAYSLVMLLLVHSLFRKRVRA